LVADLSQLLSDFFDGLCGAVIGVIAIIAAQTLKSSVGGSSITAGEDINAIVSSVSESATTAVLYVLALAVLYQFTNKYTPLLLVVVGAISGQFLFI
jgi:hypothetical protein